MSLDEPTIAPIALSSDAVDGKASVGALAMPLIVGLLDFAPKFMVNEGKLCLPFVV